MFQVPVLVKDFGLVLQMENTVFALVNMSTKESSMELISFAYLEHISGSGTCSGLAVKLNDGAFVICIGTFEK